MTGVRGPGSWDSVHLRIRTGLRRRSYCTCGVLRRACCLCGASVSPFVRRTLGSALRSWRSPRGVSGSYSSMSADGRDRRLKPDSPLLRFFKPPSVTGGRGPTASRFTDPPARQHKRIGHRSSRYCTCGVLQRALRLRRARVSPILSRTLGSVLWPSRFLRVAKGF